MQLKEILDIENNRTEDNRCVIHLFQEGTFYRAYEWSAWLCHRHINQFKVTHRHFKNVEQSVLFVGFPVTSLEKYATAVNADVIEVSENKKELLLDESVIPPDMSIEIMKVDFHSWKDSIPVVETTPKKKDEVLHSVIEGNKPIASNNGIMQKILAFPLEDRTPMQCMSFIAELKQQIVSVI